MVTLLPLGTDWPPSGLCDCTMPSWSVVLTTVLGSATRSAAYSLAVASARVMVTTLGTRTISGPLLTTIVTLVPFGTWAAAGGFCSAILPLGCELKASCVSPTLRPTAARASCAPATVRPTTLGTWAMSGPLLIVTSTTPPLESFVLGSGLWLATVSLGTLALTSSLVTDITRPTFLSWASASVRFLPMTLGTLMPPVLITMAQTPTATAASTMAITSTQSQAVLLRRGGGPCMA